MWVLGAPTIGPMPPDLSSERPVDADSVATRSFTTSFRGFDQAEVREYLTAISSALRAMKTEQDSLLLRLSVAEQRAVPAEELDPSQLTHMLGEETGRVLETALQSAQQIRAKADDHATRVLREANAEAAETRTNADQYARTTTEQADAASSALRNDADAYSTEVRQAADAEHHRLRTEAESYALETRERADSESRQVREAADGYASEVRDQADKEAAEARSEADVYAVDVKDRADSESAAIRADADAYARQTRDQAEADAVSARDAAEADAEEMRADAGEVLALRTAEAEEAAAEIRSAAEAIRTKASEDAAAEVERGRVRGERLLAEARGQRDDVNKEITRRRRASRSQLEQVSVARERLLEAYATVRQLADDATKELDRALPEARAAAEAVARKAAAEEDAESDDDVLAGPSADTPGIGVGELDTPDAASDEVGLQPEPIPDGEEEDPAIVEGKATPAQTTPIHLEETEVLVTAEEPEPREAAVAQSDLAPAAEPTAAPKRTRLFGRHRPVVEPGPQPVADAVDAAVEPATQPAAGTTVAAGAGPAPSAPDAEAGEDEGEREGAADIQALFARIRAGREEAAPASAASDADGEAPLPKAPEEDAEQGGRDLQAARRAPGPFGLGSSGSVPEGGQTVEATTIDVRDTSEAADAREVTEPPGPAVADETTASATTTLTSETIDAGTVASASTVTRFEQRDALTDAIERRLGRRLKRHLSDEQNAVLDTARRARQVSFDQVLPDLVMHRAQYAELATGDLTAATGAGWSFYQALPAGAPSAGEPRSVPIDDLADALAAELVDQLRDRVERCFIEAADDEFELGDRIRACYREWKTQRLGDIARQYVLNACSRGFFAAIPGGTPLTWLAESGEPSACPDCEDNSLAGAQPKGEAFPTGHVHPPAHPGCRCLLNPVG